MKYGDKTRFKDKNGDAIYIGDVVSVEEYPDKYVGGSLDYDGVVEWDDNAKSVVVTYYDIGEEESMPLSFFSVKGREILEERNRKAFWKSLMLGAEPPERLYKREQYYKQNEVHEAVKMAGMGINYADYAFVKF